MIVVVPNCKASVDQSLFVSREVESSKASPTVRATAQIVDQSRAVVSPIRSFERSKRLVNYFCLARFDVQNFKHAADEIAIGNESCFDGPDYSHIAEDRFLDYVG